MSEVDSQKPKLGFWIIIGHIKELVPLIGLLVALIVGWINLKNELGSIKEKQQLQDSEILIIKSKQEDLGDTINRVNENLASINTALEFIKQRVN